MRLTPSFCVICVWLQVFVYITFNMRQSKRKLNENPSHFSELPPCFNSIDPLECVACPWTWLTRLRDLAMRCADCLSESVCCFYTSFHQPIRNVSRTCSGGGCRVNSATVRSHRRRFQRSCPVWGVAGWGILPKQDGTNLGAWLRARVVCCSSIHSWQPWFYVPLSPHYRY